MSDIESAAAMLTAAGWTVIAPQQVAETLTPYEASRRAHTKRIHEAYSAKAAAYLATSPDAAAHPVEWSEGTPQAVKQEQGA